MATLIVRVQLTNGTVQNYTVLKNALLRVGFTKKITATDGTSYNLPNGNYLGESDKSAVQILEVVKRVLSRIGDTKAMVLVTEAANKGNAWINLQYYT